jgi:translation elongation factor EF-G
VAFASADMNWCFTLRSFAQMYADTYGGIEVAGFADRLWGDIYFNSERKFTRKAPDAETPRSFVEFILNPLYKLYSQVLSAEVDELKETLAGLGIKIKEAMFKMDARPLLKVVLNQFFGQSTGLVDMIVENVPNPIEGATRKVDPSASLVGMKLNTIMFRSSKHTRALKTLSSRQASKPATPKLRSWFTSPSSTVPQMLRASEHLAVS